VLPNADAASNDQVVTLGDGRVIGYREFGDPGGIPVVALHGTPGSRFKYAGGHDGAVARGLRVIALDRWGYGLSSAKPDPALADYGRDVEVLAGGLGLGRFAVTGVSGGAPFAVATAAALKGRVSALALVSPVGVIDGPAGLAELSPFHTLCFQIAPRIPGLIGGSFHAYRAALAVAPDFAMRIAVLKSAQADRAIMRNERARSGMAEMFAEGLAAGVAGPVTDMALFGRPWGIEWADVCADVRIWMGAEDRNVPVSAVRALQGALPSSTCVEIADAGHQWLAGNHEAVWDWIKERARQ
jgi:pimeloyl-ACP methyl ester carboxylesterase